MHKPLFSEMFKAFMVLALAFVCITESFAFRLCGSVIDSEGEPLLGAAVKIDGGKYGALTNSDGRYDVELPQGTHSVSVEYIGYENSEEKIKIDSDVSHNISLHEKSTDLDEVVVSATAAREKLKEIQIGVEKLSISEMQKTPSFMGENDIMKSIQTLPGVKAESEGSCGYQVRGGTSAQNRIILDNATVYNAGHLLGFFSTFNDNILASADLYKGLIPSHYGEATSSILDVSTKEPDFRKFHGGLSIGLLAAKAYVEGPIVKDKLSFSVSARRSYLDLFLKVSKDYKDNTLNFYDINARVDWKISNKDKLFVSFLYGRDNMGLNNLMDMDWGNYVGSLQWRRVISSRWRNNITAAITYYDCNTGVDVYDNTYKMNSFIHEYLLQESAVYRNSHHTFRLGAEAKFFELKSADWTINNLKQKEKRNAFDLGVWVADDWKISEKVDLSVGLRFCYFGVLGGSPYYDLDDEMNITKTYDYSSTELVKSHFGFEPRLSFNYKVADYLSLKAGYSLTSQNIQAIRNGVTSMPMDRYVMSSNIIKPQIANQVSAGGVVLFLDGMLEFTAEGYYKAIDNVYDYIDGKNFYSQIEMERLLRGGKGRSYGAEFLLKKTAGSLSGWISYTLSWSENKINGINNGEWYYASNDRRHDLSIVLMYKLPHHWEASALWAFNTGQAYTAPSAKYSVEGTTYYYYSERNGYRMNNYHRLDISFSHRKKTKHFSERLWSFGLYNAYARYNPYMIIFDDDESAPSGTSATQVSLFTIVPSVSFSIKF